DIVVEYEVIQRKSYFLNNFYISHFKEELEQERYLQYENKYLIEAIAKHTDGVSEEEIHEFLDNCRNDFSIHLQSFHQQLSQAFELERRCKNYSAKDIQDLDNMYVEYCKNYHPAIKAHSTEEERKVYSLLAPIYRIGNISAFKMLFNEYKDVFTSTHVEEEEYDTIAYYYQESMSNLKDLVSKLKNEFPLNKEDIFTETGITQELIRLREKNYKLREMNHSLHEDFKLHFSFDFELE
nr:hypothetical protein [Anaeroplasmataceae bacterium]